MRSTCSVSSLEISRQLLALLASCQTTEVDDLFMPDAFMQIWFGDIHRTYKSGSQVCQGLKAQTSSWPPKPFFNLQCWEDKGDSVTIQFDIWDRPYGRILHTNCSLTITLYHNKIKTIRLYEGQPSFVLQPDIFADQLAA